MTNGTADTSGTKPRIGFIGVGFMGHGMAANLLRKGHAVQVLGNRNRAPVDDLLAMGATEAASPAEMARTVDVLHLCLPNSAVVEATMRGPDGVLSGAREGLVVIDTTTADPGSTLRLAEELAAKGATLVDAPLGRTPREAEAGTLDAMVGCSPEMFRQIRPVIECWASTINHIGPVGSAHKMKLIMNFIAMGYAALYSEALAIGARSGISPATVRRVIGASRMSNGFFETFMAGSVGGEPEIHKFTIANAAKDTRYAAQMADAAGAMNPMGAAIKNYFCQAETAGRGADYLPALAAHVAALNGLDLSVEAAKP